MCDRCLSDESRRMNTELMSALQEPNRRVVGLHALQDFLRIVAAEWNLVLPSQESELHETSGRDGVMVVVCGIPLYWSDRDLGRDFRDILFERLQTTQPAVPLVPEPTDETPAVRMRRPIDLQVQ